MWHKDFTDRLKSWSNLRTEIQTIPLDQALHMINDWWYEAPWSGYYLHWGDTLTWPNPWQLLSDNIYCDVARGLGILYTIKLLDRQDLISAELVLTEDDRNLVLVNEEKYALNWDNTIIVNNCLTNRIKNCFIYPRI
jgi:hypothetical protein